MNDKRFFTVMLYHCFRVIRIAGVDCSYCSCRMRHFFSDGHPSHHIDLMFGDFHHVYNNVICNCLQFTQSPKSSPTKVSEKGVLVPGSTVICHKQLHFQNLTALLPEPKYTRDTDM